MKIYTIKEVQDIFAVNYWTVISWIDKKGLNAYKEGVRVKITHEALENFITTTKKRNQELWKRYKKEKGF